MTEFSINRVFRIILERIVHPSQVPFVIKAQTFIEATLRDMTIRGRIFGDHHDRGRYRMNIAIDALDEFHGAGVDAFGGIAIPINDVRDCIEANAINMECLHEIKNGADEEAANRILS